MALPLYLSNVFAVVPPLANPNSQTLRFPSNPTCKPLFCTSTTKTHRQRRRLSFILNQSDNDSEHRKLQEKEVNNPGVKAALSMLRFYKREISPLLPNSCRYVPTCSEYSMIAYQKYGVVKGTILTAWRLCRCNPLGGSGFDPPRWFGEESTLDQSDDY
ncbi:UPF0161 protein At3g09310 [Diospyros lotus]|uniref:UPF0161 protein At3g09310 n=1 Tax=Diospyros lotus TaxID=55363 RepID=UPI0022571E50|nr:UPF0161 protein At3g09310 [Diospyros lotus]XP_052172607.1 UPF0161 protein At3g09310 [Diospyros lotus]XP_052172608.1 UPF0161 protein At3g09310 [Diospyros lotus]